MFNPSYPLLTSVFDPRLVLMRSYAHNPQWPCDRCDRLPSKVCLQRHFVPSPLPSMPKSRAFCRLACCSSCLPSSLRNHSVCTLQSSLASSSTLSLMFVAFFYMFFQCSLPNFHGLSTSRTSAISCRICLARSFNANFSSKSAKSVMVPSMIPRIWDVTCQAGWHQWVKREGNVEGGFVVGASQGGKVQKSQGFNNI